MVMDKSCSQWATLHAILCTVTWVPDCLQGDVGAAQGPGLFSLAISCLYLLFILGQKKEGGNRDP